MEMISSSLLVPAVHKLVLTLCGLTIYQGGADIYGKVLVAQYQSTAYILQATKNGAPHTFEDFRFIVFDKVPSCNLLGEENILPVED
jgi:hypothetical protein